MKIQQKLDKEAEDRQTKIQEARIKISMRKQKNMEIPNKLLKIARMDEPKPAPVKPLDTPIINLQQPNPNALPHTYSHFVGTLKSKMPDSNFPAPGTYPGIVGTSTLSNVLKIKKENLDIQEYLKSGDVTKQTPPPKPSRKVIHSSAELQKILSPKCKGSGPKAKQTLFGSPCALASQMDSNEMLCSISSIKCEQMIKLDNLLKSKLLKNYADGIFQVIKGLGYSIDTHDIGDINSIPPDSLFRICSVHVPELANYHPDTGGPLLRKMLCR